MRQVCAFIGLVKYYSYMWYRRSNLLKPLTTLTSYKVTFNWTYIEHKSFEDMKCIVSCNTLLAYPSFNKFFDIHMDTIDFQIGAMISQEGGTIALYSLKLIVP